MKKIFVGMPSGSGFPYPESILNICHQIIPDNVELFFEREHIIDRLPVQLARNEIIQKFLYSPEDYTHIWFIDDDNPPSIDVLQYLVSHNKDVVSALVPLRKGNYRLCIVKDGKPIESIEGLDGPLIEVDNIGTGCVLLSRKVVQDVRNKTCGHPYQFIVEDTVRNKKEDHKELYQLQDRLVDNRKEIYMLNADGTINIQKRMCGEDLFFGERAKELGYKFYADLRARCYHFTGEINKRMVLNEKWNDLSDT